MGALRAQTSTCHVYADIDANEWRGAAASRGWRYVYDESEGPCASGIGTEASCGRAYGEGAVGSGAVRGFDLSLLSLAGALLVDYLWVFFAIHNPNELLYFVLLTVEISVFSSAQQVYIAFCRLPS